MFYVGLSQVSVTITVAVLSIHSFSLIICAVKLVDLVGAKQGHCANSKHYLPEFKFHVSTGAS